MSKTLRKHLILAAKLVVAAALLIWVFSTVHFRDFVRAPDGTTWPVLDRQETPGQPGQVTIRTGGWLDGQSETVPAERFEPIDPQRPGQVVRPGLISNFKSVNRLLLVLGVGGFALSLVIIGFRWRMLLAIQDVRIGAWEAQRLTVLGEFFNQVVPGTVGGDLVKAYYVSRHTHLRSGVLVSVFVDRVLGLAALAFMAAVVTVLVLALGLESLERIGPSLIAALVLLAVVAGMLLVVLSGRLRRLLRLQKILSRLPLARHLAEAGQAAQQYRQSPGRLLLAVGLTFLAQTAWILGVALTGLSLHLEAPVYSYFIYIPLIYIIGAVPVTPGGVGLLEKLYQTFFAFNPSTVLALALLVRLVRIVVALPGVVVAVTGARLPRAGEIEAELQLEPAAVEAES